MKRAAMSTSRSGPRGVGRRGVYARVCVCACVCGMKGVRGVRGAMWVKEN